MLELAGIRDILAKSLGTTNPINMAKATVNGLKRLRRPEDVAKMRGLLISEVLPYKHPEPTEEPAAEPAGEPAAQAPAEAPAAQAETSNGEGSEAAQPPVREADQGRGSGEPGGSPASG